MIVFDKKNYAQEFFFLYDLN